MSPPRDYISGYLHCDHRHRSQMGEACRTPFSSICHNRNFRKRGLSVQSPSSSDNDKLKVTTVVRQIMKEFNEVVSEEDKVMIVTMMVLDLMQRNGC
jgi:hypothetical protein